MTGIPGSTGAPGATGATGPQGIPGKDAPTYRGAFHSTFTDTLAAQYAAQAMGLNVTDDSNGVIITNDGGTSCSVVPYCGNIVIANAGTYNMQFSAQLSKSTSGNYNVVADIWLARKRAGEAAWNKLAWTATRVYVPSDTDFTVAAWNFMLVTEDADEYRLMWASPDTNWNKLSVVSGTPTGYPLGQEPPQIPGLILTVQSAG